MQTADHPPVAATPAERRARRVAQRGANRRTTCGRLLAGLLAPLIVLETPMTAAATSPDVLRPAGQATLRFLGLKIYDASLRVAPGFSAGDYARHRFELSLQYARRLEGRLIAERSLIEMRRIEAIAPERATRWMDFMLSAFPDVQDGDRLSGLNEGQGRVRFLLNGQPHREIEDADFARLFFGIWLHPATSQPEMRRALLGDTA